MRVGALIENAGCFPGSSVYQNLMMQAINLNLEKPDGEISRVLKIVRMEDSAKIKFKSCSLGMKQRIGIAMALLGSPALLMVGMFLFMTAPMLTPLNSSVMNVVLCFAGGILFRAGFDAVSNQILKKTSLV